MLFQAGSIVTESFRLSLIQILLQQRGIKLNPITTLYYIAPACFCFLLLPFSFLEAPVMMGSTTWVLQPTLLLGSASIAFGERGLQATTQTLYLLETKCMFHWVLTSRKELSAENGVTFAGQ